ncbi:TlpA family protein disulfide reductase [Azospirillum doebereinerae]|uniref:TlpA family protein disulfide reductase n=1 Tax=Azospirillum doebereinerae TaxID=92933 RepID=A0A3S0V3C0_9PROT|nr:TlpA disulfide reductase family protein [Azospirillum doebereinerae]RUQ62516.1 TlpA family protein disulfide reductase [Azospirillum doebereinerae]
MRTLAATATVCVCLAGVGLWWSAAAGPAAPEVLRLGAPDASPAAPPAGATLVAGLDKFRGAEAPKPVPPLAFVDGEGRRVDLDAFTGKLVLLNLWATWCGPCVKEMPSLDRLQAQLGGDAFQVVALSLDRGGRGAVEPFYAKTGVGHLALFLDPGSASMQVLGLRGLPTTLLVDQEGRELGRVEGAVEWDSPEVVAFLRQRMGHGAGPARDRGIVKTGG